MNYKIINNKLKIEDTILNISKIDFILLNGKIKVYLSDGDICTINSGFSADEKIDLYKDIEYSLTRNNNFISLKGGRIINMDNVRSVIINKDEFLIITNGFSLELTDLRDKDIKLLQDFQSKSLV